MASTGYPVPAAEASAELRFQNSRFLGIAGPAGSVEEARSFIRDIRERYPDASHHVYAFAIGYGASLTLGMSDDGEPPGTAGRPVLAVVKGAELGDVVVVVTRYFGGTKLGTGGLVRAYTATAQAALAEVSRAVKITWQTVGLEVPYAFYEPCKAAIEAVGGGMGHEEFAEKVTLQARVPEEHVEDLDRAVQDITSGRVSLDRGVRKKS
jgi:uncharacterized YigZ family protein